MGSLQPTCNPGAVVTVCFYDICNHPQPCIVEFPVVFLLQMKKKQENYFLVDYQRLTITDVTNKSLVYFCGLPKIDHATTVNTIYNGVYEPIQWYIYVYIKSWVGEYFQ